MFGLTRQGWYKRLKAKKESFIRNEHVLEMVRTERKCLKEEVEMIAALVS